VFLAVFNIYDSHMSLIKETNYRHASFVYKSFAIGS